MKAPLAVADAPLPLPTKRKRPQWGDRDSKCRRKTTAAVFSSGAQRPLYVTIYPDGLIGLRLSKHRREEYADAASIYRQAVISRVAAERAARKKK